MKCTINDLPRELLEDIALKKHNAECAHVFVDVVRRFPDGREEEGKALHLERNPTSKAVTVKLDLGEDTFTFCIAAEALADFTKIALDNDHCSGMLAIPHPDVEWHPEEGLDYEEHYLLRATYMFKVMLYIDGGHFGKSEAISCATPIGTRGDDTIFRACIPSALQDYLDSCIRMLVNNSL
jgi:hypothetical protein